MVELIRKIEPELIERLVQLETEAFGEGGMNAWHLVPLIRHGRVYISRKDKQIIGSVQYMLDWDNRKKAYMVGVSICKESRGEGLGTELLTESFKALLSEEIQEVELTVDPDNVGAVKVYKSKLGFVTADFRTSEYGEGEDRLVMTLALANFVEQKTKGEKEI